MKGILLEFEIYHISYNSDFVETYFLLVVY